MARARASLAAAAAALALVAGGADAAELGTLFHTPEERERLERLRRGEPDEPQQAARAIEPEVTGFVRRSDGRSTIWINGRPVIVSTPKAAPLLDPRVVRDAAEPVEGVKVERRDGVKP